MSSCAAKSRVCNEICSQVGRGMVRETSMNLCKPSFLLPSFKRANICAACSQVITEQLLYLKQSLMFNPLTGVGAILRPERFVCSKKSQKMSRTSYTLIKLTSRCRKDY